MTIPHAFRRRLAGLTLPYFRMELPGWERLSGLIGLPIENGPLWAGATPRTIRGKTHGLLMTLHMQDWCERLTYFLGRYYERPLELLVNALVRPGETFIDVGGNTGMVTLMGAARVGRGGRIYTFEPNPTLAARIAGLVQMNGLEGVVIVQAGLSDVKADLPLTIASESNGWSTFAGVDLSNPALNCQTVIAPVAPADDLLPPDLSGSIAVKIDVEGFECRVLRGMARLIERSRPAVITEVKPHVLQLAGSSVAELFGIMHRHGYTGYSVESVRKGFSHTLVVRELRHGHDRLTNTVVWTHPESVHHARLKAYDAGGATTPPGTAARIRRAWNEAGALTDASLQTALRSAVLHARAQS